MDWNDINLDTFMKYEAISEASGSDLEKTVSMVSLMFGMTEDEVYDLPLEKFKKYVSELTFLSELPAPEQPATEYTINGHKYILSLKPKDITAGQWMDFQATDKKDYARLLTIFLVPKGKKYNDGYDIEEVLEDMKILPIPVVLTLIGFFFLIYRAYTKALLAYSLRMTRKAKTPEAIQVRKKIKELMDSLSYS